MGRKRAVLFSADRQHDDDGAVGLAALQVLGGLVDPLEQLPAVGGAGPRHQLRQHLAELLAVGRVVHQLEELARDGAQRELGAPVQALNETSDPVAEDPGAVVVDDDRDLHRAGGRTGLQDLAYLTAFLDGEIGPARSGTDTPLRSVAET